MKYNSIRHVIYACILIIVVFPACKNQNSQTTTETDTTQQSSNNTIPDFNADTAYTYVEKQVSFGPRVPGTPAQKECAGWMEEKLQLFCDTVYRQNTQVKAGNGKLLPCINLIGSINPKATRRILLLTHWDSRPWADMDIKDKDKPILAADDAGSGVAVLLELARQIKSHKLPASLGIDILFTDVEDYGRSEWGDNSYCLGTQYWATHPHVPGYKADFGILLDMVGARDAQFPLEAFSSQYAGDVQQRIWQAAGKAGYTSYFPFTAGAAITDDHMPVNNILHIPTVDIINLTTNMQTPFASHWHTHQDNMDIIDKNTLKAVGQTLLQVIYEMVQPA